MSQSLTAEYLLALVAGWERKRGPRYLALADAIQDAVHREELEDGTRLPPERALAQLAKIGRGTVVAAYAELSERGVVERRQGSGTRLTTGLQPSGSRTLRAALFGRAVQDEDDLIDLSFGAPWFDPSAEELSGDASAAIAAGAPIRGYAPLGLPGLRSAIAERLTSHGTPTTDRQVMVTTGAQGALQLLTTALVRRGDRVVVEAPTYPGAMELFSRAGAVVVAVRRDHSGARPDDLARALGGPGAALVFLVPTCSYPTGAIMSEHRRREILSLCAEHDVLLVDDQTPSDVMFGGTAAAHAGVARARPRGGGRLVQQGAVGRPAHRLAARRPGAGAPPRPAEGGAGPRQRDARPGGRAPGPPAVRRARRPARRAGPDALRGARGRASRGAAGVVLRGASAAAGRCGSASPTRAPTSWSPQPRAAASRSRPARTPRPTTCSSTTSGSASPPSRRCWRRPCGACASPGRTCSAPARSPPRCRRAEQRQRTEAAGTPSSLGFPKAPMTALATDATTVAPTARDPHRDARPRRRGARRRRALQPCHRVQGDPAVDGDRQPAASVRLAGLGHRHGPARAADDPRRARRCCARTRGGAHAGAHSQPTRRPRAPRRERRGVGRRGHRDRRSSGSTA